MLHNYSLDGIRIPIKHLCGMEMIKVIDYNFDIVKKDWNYRKEWDIMFINTLTSYSRTYHPKRLSGD